MTGRDGDQRAGLRWYPDVYYLLHGDLVRAARHHLVALIAVPFLIYAFAGWAGRGMVRRQPSAAAAVPLGVCGLRGGVAVYAVVPRNLPWAPFTWFDIQSLDQ